MSTEAKEKLERLRARRRGYRGVCTKLEKEAKELLLKECENDNVERCEVIYQQFDGKLKILNELDEEILNSCDVEEIQGEIEDSAEISDRILSTKRKLEKYTKTAKAKGAINTNVNNGNTIADSNSTTPVNQGNIDITTESEGLHASSDDQTTNEIENEGNTSINAGSSGSTTGKFTSSMPKLPKLELPKFNGKVTEWSSFWDLYDSAIHSNPSISKVNKFNYLKSLLEGNAARAIKGLTLTNANYDAAIKILNDRFGKTQQTIAAHMDEILKIQACTNGRTSQLRYIYDKVSVHVRGLASLGVSSEQYGSMLIPIIMTKLPNEIRLQIARKSSGDVWKIDELLDTIKAEIEAREISEGVQSGPQPVKNNGVPPHTPRVPTAGAFSTQNKPGKHIQCVYCKEHHFSASCDRVIDSNDRKNLLRRDNRCFICLGTGHRSTTCESGKNCRRCHGAHHQSICNLPKAPHHPSAPAKPKPPTGVEETSESKDPNHTRTGTLINRNDNSTTITTKSRNTVLLQTAVTYAHGGSTTNPIPVRVLLDSGSQRSYITNSLRKRLGLVPIRTETLNLNTFGNDHFTKQRCDLVQLFLKGKNSNRKITALCFERICSPLSTTVDLNLYPHLQDLQLSDPNILEGRQTDSNIDILIGADYYFEILTGEMIRGESGPVAINSEFGWVIAGQTHDVESCSKVSGVNLLIEEPVSSSPVSFGMREEDHELSNCLNRFWEIESMGIKDEEETEPEFLENIQYLENEERYEVNLPWRANRIPKSNSYSMCLKRLYQLKSRLDKDKPLLQEYDKIIKDQEKMRIIEPVVVSDETSHFLPHHGVLREDKETTRLRVVFDGSAKATKDDLSLNDCLEKGPNLVPHLFDTVINFRGYPIGLVADIEKAFHQVQIAPEDRKMLKFLWFEDLSQDYPTLKEYEFRRLPFGLTPSPAILSTIIAHHLTKFKETEPEIVSLLLESLYVDDFAGGAYNDDEALHIYRRSRDLMSKAGFKLRKWHSNSSRLRTAIAEEENRDTSGIEEKELRPNSTSTELNSYASVQNTVVDTSVSCSSSSDLSTSKENCIKILGINWNEDCDELCYDLEELVEYAKSLPATKRSVLKLSAKVFDPIGLFAPFTVTMKMLFQTLCTSNINWDDELEGNALTSWNSLVNDLRALSDIRVPRCYFHLIGESTPTHQIHGFCDASDLAFAAVVYLRTEHSNGEVEVNLVASKTRIAPIKRQTIPRLELLGANTLARLVNTIVKALTSIKVITDVILWTDSFTTLCWIRNHKLWKTYVQNRVNEIRKLTNGYEWRHCPGVLNPADLPSRGCCGRELADSEVWWNGPQFLKETNDKWPEDPQPTSKDDCQAYNEIMKCPTPITHSLVGVSVNDQRPINIEKIIDPERYSTKTRLLRVTAQVFRLVKKLRTQSCTMPPEITVDELIEAEKVWIRSIQSTAFTEEIQCIRTGRMNLRVKQLGLFLDDDKIVRGEGRIRHSSVPDDAKQPILLPSKHYFTKLVVLESHEAVHHDGIRETLNCVRGKYWILRGRECVKGIVRKCYICKRLEGKTFPTPKEAVLPPIRVSEDPPFTNTGIDFAGPLYSTTNRETEKVYICLFTCTSTRAVHLELVRSLSVPSFLQAFRRFVSRRGLPARLITDNAKTFKSASKEVKNILRSTEILRELASKGVKWEFIIEKAPWQGGFYERMIQSTKRCLKKTLGRSSVDFESLRTMLVEIEATINNRPLTYVYDDEEGISYPLTPSQLIYGRQISLTPSDRQFDIISTNRSLTRKARNQKRLLDQFMNRWRTEYLLSLREISRKLHESETKTIAVGDVVVLKNDSSPRVFWKLARVTELIESKDGVIRAAKICVLNSTKGRVTTLRRPIQHLVPLELTMSADTANVSQRASEGTSTVEEDTPRKRPRRTAAVIGEIRRKEAKYF